MSAIAAGFGDTIHDSQFCFRQLLTAMSQPGTLVELNLVQGFGHMMPASTQVLLALADNSTPVWLSEQFEHDVAVTENLNFHLGCSLLKSQQHDIQKQANFALIAEQDVADFNWSQSQFYVGNEEYPDRSTTVIVEVAGLSNQPCGSALHLSLTGPGIETEKPLFIQSHCFDSLNAMLTLRKTHRFPLGLDFIVVSGEQVVALPRSTTVEVMPCM
ncbi:phosphonate C-P lyase system protein PhnH [Vibrio rumoiensis]|uniref:Phosphonate C-P lyase system protein PhnH n=1 Tax=Vibrio rumoiensis 1S-45 TaxID=1188252 RepID=A0A1E5E5I0_9VIBR|nr:phosphonate C-P lyase system protein PhnH [Vibrio rumoiensis]OEF28978.1 phosphonate C-P lyase system protein PhnH [Vibrio rumoiensis 1S-45]